MPVCPGIFKQGVPRFARDRRLFKPEGSRDRRGEADLLGVARERLGSCVVSGLVMVVKIDTNRSNSFLLS